MVGRGVRRTVIALTFATACGPTTGQQPPAAPNRGAPGSWELTLHMSGGFVGMDRTLELASTGAMRASDRRRSASASSQATEQELAQITSFVAALDMPAAAPRTAECNDCFEYTVNVGAANGSCSTWTT